MSQPAAIDVLADAPAAEIARLVAENESLRASLAEATQRAAVVDQRYLELWRTVSEAANTMLAANHPLA